jgi:8-oxo-dGTP pyrophosphatase MutT (NUDIX family)
VAEARARIPPALRGTAFPEVLIPAAVLVGLVDDPRGPQVLLTQRTDSLRDHPGQVSFPGGRFEPDDRDTWSAALRELGEEVGIGHEHVQLLGHLPAHPVITGYAVAPVVARIAGGLIFRPDPIEVAEVFTVPLEFFTTAANLEFRAREVHGIAVQTPSYRYAHRQIWGATAMIIRTLCIVLDGGDARVQAHR